MFVRVGEGIYEEQLASIQTCKLKKSVAPFFFFTICKACYAFSKVVMDSLLANARAHKTVLYACV